MTAPATETMALVQKMDAIEQIKQLKAAYCRLVDTKDFVGWAQLFTPDARFDVREFAVARNPLTNELVPDDNFSLDFLQGLTTYLEWPVIGREGIAGAGETITADVISTHHVFTPEVTLTDEHSASAIWPMEDYAWFAPGGPVSYMHGLGHYHETYATLDDGRWYLRTVDLTRLKVEWR
jgi:hypothetical protein